MAANKTSATLADPEAYVAAIDDATRRTECAALIRLMRRVTGTSPTMWGPSIVGFGVHRYPLAGGKTGEICAVGLSSRKSEFAIYGVVGVDGAAALLAALGRHRASKGCLYVRRLADVDIGVLESLIALAFARTQA